jgi:hypothetical protein
MLKSMTGARPSQPGVSGCQITIDTWRDGDKTDLRGGAKCGSNIRIVGHPRCCCCLPRIPHRGCEIMKLDPSILQNSICLYGDGQLERLLAQPAKWDPARAVFFHCRRDRFVQSIPSLVVRKAKTILPLVLRFSSRAPQHCSDRAHIRVLLR